MTSLSFHNNKIIVFNLAPQEIKQLFSGSISIKCLVTIKAIKRTDFVAEIILSLSSSFCVVDKQHIFFSRIRRRVYVKLTVTLLYKINY